LNDVVIVSAARLPIGRFGGAIALGHPISATGCILLTKIICEMKRQKSQLGLVTMCIAGGQGIAMIGENE